LTLDGGAETRVLVQGVPGPPGRARNCCTRTSITWRWTRSCASPCRCT
jgi:hypothetical protein